MKEELLSGNVYIQTAEDYNRQITKRLSIKVIGASRPKKIIILEQKNAVNSDANRCRFFSNFYL